MSRLRPLTLLFILLGAVPLIIGASGVVSYLLWRAGNGLFVWGLLPLAASLLLVGVLGAILGLAAGGTRRSSEENDGAVRKGPRGEDDV
ncbi:MAG: hypothetical protein AVDCRST_MAG37-2601 [uncultured Rubrobacteraceae bacterium]|uniref:Uncharacterized protein n=1 Tax=uncultured Rubrobacteraceae bacterium TaxID=349277 RepID=A0A6J4R0A3_9ACTN|nr:MAG: hypothetical protein AVDCRST_MAG37-2601 [uncultured Rubrobacteraceae bacterium]